MEIYDRLDDLAQLIETARAVPLSTSCVVPRNEALDMVEDARDVLPDSIREADDILAKREQILDDAHREAEELVTGAQDQSHDMVVSAQQDADRIVDNARNDADDLLNRARDEARRMIDEQEVLLRAQQEAAALLEDAQLRARSILEDAQGQAEEMLAQAATDSANERRQTDEFVDGKLAELEEALGTSLTAVRRGRDRVHARHTAFDPVDLRGAGAGPGGAPEGRNQADRDELIFNTLLD